MSRLPEWAERYTGIDYEEMNCWQLVMRIYATEFGLAIGDKEQQAQHMMDKFWQQVESPREGDVVLFKNNENERHVGVILGVNGYMIHNQRGSNSCIESYYNSLWKHRVVGFYRHVDRAE
jgi:cell wall-associated NlpC family hydrolase